MHSELGRIDRPQLGDDGALQYILPLLLVAVVLAQLLAGPAAHPHCSAALAIDVRVVRQQQRVAVFICHRPTSVYW